jgi:hypothetical protein
VNSKSYTICWYGVVSPYVCTSGAKVSGAMGRRTISRHDLRVRRQGLCACILPLPSLPHDPDAADELATGSS